MLRACWIHLSVVPLSGSTRQSLGACLMSSIGTERTSLTLGVLARFSGKLDISSALLQCPFVTECRHWHESSLVEFFRSVGHHKDSHI